MSLTISAANFNSYDTFFTLTFLDIVIQHWPIDPSFLFLSLWGHVEAEAGMTVHSQRKCLHTGMAHCMAPVYAKCLCMNVALHCPGTGLWCVLVPHFHLYCKIVFVFACMLVLVVFMFSISYVTNLALWLREFNKLTYLLRILCCMFIVPSLGGFVSPGIGLSAHHTQQLPSDPGPAHQPQQGHSSQWCMWLPGVAYMADTFQYRQQSTLTTAQALLFLSVMACHS